MVCIFVVQSLNMQQNTCLTDVTETSLILAKWFLLFFSNYNNGASPTLNWPKSPSWEEHSWLNRRATDTDSRWKEVSLK